MTQATGNLNKRNNRYELEIYLRRQKSSAVALDYSTTDRRYQRRPNLVTGRNDAKYASVETMDIPELFCQIYIFVCQVDVGYECPLLVHSVSPLDCGVNGTVEWQRTDRGEGVPCSLGASSNLIMRPRLVASPEIGGRKL